MDRVALRQKISIFTRGLETEEDATVRQMVRRFLAQAEAELARLELEKDMAGRRLVDLGISKYGRIQK